MMNESEIEIVVTTRYLQGQSDPAQKQFVFAYTIDITNCSAEPLRLLTREWTIQDADGKLTQVSGDGVVGKQPWIEPGGTFTYTSGTVLNTPLGSMQGSYGLVTADGTAVQAKIPPFSLALPNMLH